VTIQQATLCILTRGSPPNQVLLGYKKIGFGQGKYTGFGGKVEPGETIAAAACRELLEETGISIPPEKLISMGVLTFLFPNQPAWNQEVHVCRIENWQGEPVESDEMAPEWFAVDQLPFERMWDDGRYWLPPILSGLTYFARFTFKDDNATIDQVAFEASPVLLSPLSLAPIPLLASTLDARADLLADDPRHESAVRLFNGFLEGFPELVADLYADTLVLQDHAKPSQTAASIFAQAQAFYLDRLPWIRATVIKTRAKKDRQESQSPTGISSSSHPTRKIREHGVWYALDLLLHQDTTFYPDTRYLRRWAIEHLSNQRVLNTFAYTGSLGVAALAGGARQVIQLDLNRTYLNLAKTSYTLNGFPIQRDEFIVGDFFPRINTLKREGARFDCVFLDPPFFSVTGKGRVDLVTQYARLINKVRPLISDGGWLAAVNNALFLSGKDYMEMLRELCSDGYLSVEELIPVPFDCAGYHATRIRSLPADPAPFNHATKIVILRVRRKQNTDSSGDDRQVHGIAPESICA
jgi:23S rRNA (cytosine1962-C5)-methyltransferase